ncbi:Hypothetical protein CINCED_3A024617 [Cinara cedri]|uniref:Uncharacterized protein n=1 Tax=Cinara cedri TaxID=506608 RepID=A0A5E4N1K6_9HEMI|nr:Hypothetical protein CINCED_3A024617 [Cinara cedri]
MKTRNGKTLNTENADSGSSLSPRAERPDVGEPYQQQTSSMNVNRRSTKRQNRPKRVSQRRIQRARSEKVITARNVGFINSEALYAITTTTPSTDRETVELLLTVTKKKLMNVIRRKGPVSEIALYFSKRMIAKLKNRRNRVQ